MNVDAMPIIRIEIESMKHQIMTMLGMRGSELGEAINARIDDAIKNYDFGTRVQRITNNCITEAIELYFKDDGNGAKTIKKAVNEALDKVFVKDDG